MRLSLKKKKKKKDLATKKPAYEFYGTSAQKGHFTPQKAIKEYV